MNERGLIGNIESSIVSICGFVLFLVKDNYFATFGSVQLEASTNQELNQRVPLFNLPSKILCRVIHTQLLVFFRSLILVSFAYILFPSIFVL